MNIPVRWLVPAILVMVLSPIASVLASVQIAQNNARHIQQQAEQRQAVAEAKAAEKARVLACQFFGSNLDVYDETPPTTAAGRNLRDTWIKLYNLSHCQPVRNK
jgi:hypothetical protein